MNKQKILIIRDFYPKAEEEFIRKLEEFKWDFSKSKEIANELNYDIQRALSIHLEKYFHIVDIFVSSEIFQKKWEEKFFKENTHTILKLLKCVKPVSKIGFFAKEDFYRVLAKQVLYYQPQIIINLNLGYINPYLFKNLKKYENFKLIGYYGATRFEFSDLSPYDFFFSPFLPYVIKMKKMGIKSEYIPLGFESHVLQKLSIRYKEIQSKQNYEQKHSNNQISRTQKIYDIVFAGSLHRAHRSRIPLLEAISETFGDKFHIYTQSETSLTEKLKRNFKGVVFHTDYFEVLSKAKIVINHHGDILPWAHNLRLFETTGVGSFLLTDELPGLGDLFEKGKEIETYKDISECIQKIKYYLEHEEEREKIAKLGQKRTLKDHTYEKRVEKLIETLKMHKIID